MSDTAGKRFPFSLPRVSAPSLPSVKLNGLLANQKVIWGLFIVLLVAAVAVSLFRGFIFARLGMNLPIGFTISPVVWEIIANVHYAAFVVGYMVALPLDTVPGRGKYSEFVGDAAFGAVLFLAAKAASSLGFVVERVAIHWGTGVPAETFDVLAVEVQSVAGYGLAAIGLAVVLKIIVKHCASNTQIDDEDED